MIILIKTMFMLNCNIYIYSNKLPCIATYNLHHYQNAYLILSYNLVSCILFDETSCLAMSSQNKHIAFYFSWIKINLIFIYHALLQQASNCLLSGITFITSTQFMLLSCFISFFFLSFFLVFWGPIVFLLLKSMSSKTMCHGDVWIMEYNAWDNNIMNDSQGNIKWLRLHPPPSF